MADEHDEGEGERRPFDIEGAINSLIARSNNDARLALRTLSEDNYQYRRTLRSLKKKVAELEKRPELKQGEQVVAGDRLKLLQDFEALQVKPEDVKTALSERDDLKTKDTERKQFDTIVRGVKPLRMNPEVLADLIRTRNYQFETHEVEVEDEEGKKVAVNVLHLRKADTDGWSPADKFAEKELKGYLPALRVNGDEDGEESENDEEAEDSAREDDERPRRRPFPKQASGTGSRAPRDSKDVVTKHIQGRYVTPSKLRSSN
jgi:hypothetical protein